MPSDDENEEKDDKENINDDEDDYDTLSEEEDEEENEQDINNNEFKLKDSKLSNESVKMKKSISNQFNKSKNKNNEEPMEFT